MIEWICQLGEGEKIFLPETHTTAKMYKMENDEMKDDGGLRLMDDRYT